MYSIDIKNNKEIYDYCMRNGITDINKFVQDCFKQGYDIKKYGLLGKTLNEGEKDLIKEVIVEKQVEIPVEVIKEVEIIKEVPVEKEVIKEVVREIPVEKVVIQEVIKEVPIDRVIEKEVYITDDTQVNELLLKIQQLENEMSKKDEELDKLRQTLDELLAKPPVEVIKEIEKIVEDPVTNNKLNMLQETLQNLRGDLQLKNEEIKELQKINEALLNGNPNSAYLLRGSNLNRRL